MLACGVVAEAEVFSLVDLGDVEGVAEDGLGEVVGGGVAEGVGEGEDEGGVEAGGGEEFELAGEWGDEGEGLSGAEDVGGVGVEGDGEGAAAEEARAGDDLGDDGLVAEVDAVEVADGGDGGGLWGRDFCEVSDKSSLGNGLREYCAALREGIPQGLKPLFFFGRLRGQG